MTSGIFELPSWHRERILRVAFSVGTKLLGLYFLYLGLFSTINATLSLVAYSNQAPTGVGSFIVFGLLTALLQLMLGALLVVKTGWFVRLARIEEGDVSPLRMNELLPLGVTLIGVATLARAVGPLLSDFFLYFFRDSFDATASALVVWVNLLNLAVAFGLIVFAKRISAALTRWQSD